jgi:hypothetical protein
MKNLISHLWLVSLGWSISPASSHAAALFFSDKGSFLSQTHATELVSRIGFTAEPPSSVNSELFDWSPRLTGPELAINDVENLNVDLVGPTYSFGFDFVEPEHDPVFAPFFDSKFVISLKNGGATVAAIPFEAPNDVLWFIGVWSDTPFTRVEIREVVGHADNEYFGRFYTGGTPAPASVMGFQVPWWTVDGGGGISSGSGFEVAGTIGQPDAASPLAGGCWSVDPGFWGEYAVIATPGAPALRIRLISPTYVRVSFTPGCGDWILQRAATLNTEPPATAWADDPPGELIPVGDELVRDFHLPSWGPRLFFRLRKP